MNSEQIGRIAERFTEVFESLKAESDRGCVLIVASMIEQILENYISLCLVPKVSSEDELLSRSGSKPISSFSAKINLAYRLGLIPKEERSIYHQLRELRNVCAHNIDRQDFVANHFKDRTRNIINNSAATWEALQNLITPILQPGKLATVEEFVEKLGWRVAFAMYFAVVVSYKEAAIVYVPRLRALRETVQPPRTQNNGTSSFRVEVACPALVV